MLQNNSLSVIIPPLPAPIKYDNAGFPIEECLSRPQSSLSTAETLLNSPYARSEFSIGKSEVYIVDWDGPTDPRNPRNWKRPKKWAQTIIVSAFALIAPLSSSMIAPALDQVGRDFQISTVAEVQIVLSVFLLAYSFGPFVLSPLSEVFGRKPIMQYGNLFFIVSNWLCGYARNKNELIVLRLAAGFGGSATLGIGSGVLSDCWRPEERGRGSSIYQLAPVLGPAIGPILGGLIAQNSTWRWAFWSVTCFNIAIQLAGLLFLRETYPPKLLAVKARTIRKETGNPAYRTKWQDQGRTVKSLLGTSLTRPWKLLLTQPIIQIIAIYQAYNYGMLYLFISSFPSLWVKGYGMSPAIGSLNYISLAVGLLIGSQICGPSMDFVYRRLKEKNGLGPDENGLPEFRIPVMIPAAILEPCGILLYGWAAQAKLHWIFPNIGAALFCANSMILYQGLQLYVADTYGLYTSSASAATMFLRSLAAFSFPLFGPYLFEAIGYGWGGSTLALIAFVLGVPAPIIFWKFGARLRKHNSLETPE